jgi:anti-sigma factor RsiW
VLDFLEVKEVAAAHVRAVAGTGMVDKQAAAPAELGSWFNSRVAYRVDVEDLGGYGFPLIGARLDYLLEKPVATLVYGRENHPISLFVFPAKAGDPMAVRGTKHGYNVVGWSDGTFAYFAASNLSRSELDKLEAMMTRARAADDPLMAPEGKSP